MHKKKKKAESSQPRWIDSRISEATKKLLERRRIMKRDNNRSEEYSFVCRLIRRKLKENLEDYKHRRLVKTAGRKQSLRICRREHQPTMAPLKRKDR